MVHEFDFVTERSITEQGTTENQVDQLGEIEVGPDQDEVWDILDIYHSFRASAEGTVTDDQRMTIEHQLSVSENAMLLPASELDTAGARSESHRVLWASGGAVVAPIQDETNGLGHSGQQYQNAVHLRFDPGDMRISFPGNLALDLSWLNASTATFQSRQGVTVHYRSNPRHS